MTSREFRSLFWDDLAADLEDPAFHDSYTQTTAEIAAFDRAANEHPGAEADANRSRETP